jgi:hypothetical protein
MRAETARLLLVLALAAALHGEVREYAAVTGFGVINQGSDSVIVVRRFVQDTQVSYLAVDPCLLSTFIIGSKELFVTRAPWQALYDLFAEKPYIRALKLAAALGDSLHNAGIRSFTLPGEGIVLTVDLCPSKRTLDRTLFTGITERNDGDPVPIAVSVAGYWLKSHEDDLNWLKNYADSGCFAVTWINHSYNHYLKDSLPDSMNFLLEKGTDLVAEVLWTEKIMLNKGLVPSVFFRFPGLVSDSALFAGIIDYGLIPVGRDERKSRGRKAHDRPIALVHGNGNDPRGVRAFIALLEQKRQRILEKKWGLFDLRESMAREAKK